MAVQREPEEPEPPPAQPGRVRAVLKFGGEVVADPDALQTVLAEVHGLVDEGWSFVVVHGGGPQAGALQERLGLSPRKVAGRRVTDDATLSVMKQAVAGEVTTDLVAYALGEGIDAIGISGVSGRLVRAKRRPVAPLAEAGGEVVDYGHVGEVVAVRTELIELLWGGGLTPVLNPLGVDLGDAKPPQVYNINADTIASSVAAALGADHLFLVTGVPGVLEDKNEPATRIPRLTASQAREAVESGVIAGGMIPKVLDVLEHLERGIGAVHILAPSSGALSQEARTPGSRGTVLLRDAPAQ